MVILKKNVSTFSPGATLHKSLNELFSICRLSCAETMPRQRISAMFVIAQASANVLTLGTLKELVFHLNEKYINKIPSHHLCNQGRSRPSCHVN